MMLMVVVGLREASVSCSKRVLAFKSCVSLHGLAYHTLPAPHKASRKIRKGSPSALDTWLVQRCANRVAVRNPQQRNSCLDFPVSVRLILTLFAHC